MTTEAPRWQITVRERASGGWVAKATCDDRLVAFSFKDTADAALRDVVEQLIEVIGAAGIAACAEQA